MTKIKPLNKNGFSSVVLGTVICSGCGNEVFAVRKNKYCRKDRGRIVLHFLSGSFKRCSFSDKPVQ